MNRWATITCALLLGACRPAAAPAPSAVRGEVTRAEVERELSALAADSMEGRGTATVGGARAARYLAEVLRRSGVEPVGGAYFQRVPLNQVTRRGGRRGLVLAADSASAPADTAALNLAGMVPGRDPALRGQYILVDAHYDHLGIGRPVAGDSIYNGADDDASGVVAVLQIAQAMAAAPPRRSVLFLLTTGEEVGLLGTRWFLSHPLVPLDSIVANLEIEMIGRPDSLAGGPGHGWLTGYPRSTMGELFSRAGLPIGPDPRPAQHFFQRSDNIAFALRGIPAHTLSSFNLHSDYHQPSDEIGAVDPDHMTRLIRAAVDGVRLLADAPTPPTWNPGGRPQPGRE